MSIPCLKKFIASLWHKVKFRCLHFSFILFLSLTQNCLSRYFFQDILLSTHLALASAIANQCDCHPSAHVLSTKSVLQPTGTILLTHFECHLDFHKLLLILQSGEVSCIPKLHSL